MLDSNESAGDQETFTNWEIKKEDNYKIKTETYEEVLFGEGISNTGDNGNTCNVSSVKTEHLANCSPFQTECYEGISFSDETNENTCNVSTVKQQDSVNYPSIHPYNEDGSDQPDQHVLTNAIEESSSNMVKPNERKSTKGMFDEGKMREAVRRIIEENFPIKTVAKESGLDRNTIRSMASTSKRGIKRKRPLTKDEFDELSLWSSDSETEDGLLDSDEEDSTSEENVSSVDHDAPSTSRDFDSREWCNVDDVLKEVPNTLKPIKDYSNEQTVLGLENCNPLQCFLKLFPEEIFDLVARETNKYAKERIEKMSPLPPKSRYRNWKEVSTSDMKAYIAVEIAMGILQLPTLEDYFLDKEWLIQTPGFRMVFTRDRYLLIRTCLHFVDNSGDQSERLYKILPILNIVKDLYTEIYIPRRELIINESMVKFNGNLNFKQYMPSKPSTKGGVKIWSLCDAKTGYLLNFDVYTGKSNEKFEGGLASKVVQNLMQNFVGKGHIVYMDYFFSSVGLFDILRGKETGACGTVKSNRRGLPKDMSKCKLKRNELPVIYKDNFDSLIACSWQDIDRVNMLSSIGDTSTTLTTIKSKSGDREVRKPSVQVLYNQIMGGVDVFDQLCSTYPLGRKNLKWYKCLWYFIIEVALVNSRICYNIQNPTQKLSAKKFRLKIIDGLLEGHVRFSGRRRGHRTSAAAIALRLSERHFPSKFEDSKHKPNCAVCSISHCAKKGKAECKRKQTTFFCNQCPEKPPLCVIPCFETYHTVEKFRKVCQCKN